MSEPSVLFQMNGEVAVVTLNEAERMNPLSESLQAGLMVAIERVKHDTAIRALLLTARGRGFCSGADLKQFSERQSELGPDDSLGRYVGRMMDETANPILYGLRTLPVPVVTAVNGVAAGGGFGIALAGDVVLAARSSYFYLPFVPALGIVPDMAAVWMATRSVGRARAAALTLMGGKLPAEQAQQWGLIWSCVDDDRLMPEALSVAQNLAQLPGHSITEVRALLDEAERLSVEDQLLYERQRQEELIDGESFGEGVRAFLARRRPQFRGR